MPKSEIHPNWIENTPVLCDGKLICFVGSTKPELTVDIFYEIIHFIQIHKQLLIQKVVLNVF